MNKALSSRWPAFFCALLLLVCALATYPIAEIGMTDDWSYVESARILAQTGHIVYNGWATAMLGWQLFLGALFDKLFGPSFTAIRASTLLIALITAFLTQRTLVRAGINSRNATTGTLALVLSPIFLPFAVSFMSDVGGLFCVVLCTYACLRALQAHNNRAVIAWLAFAALSNALGGTVRQIAWLGVLVMFPCAVWLLRGRRHVLTAGALLYAISLLVIFGSNHWFQEQPHFVAIPLILRRPDTHHLKLFAVHFLSFFLSGALILLPILIAFVSAISFRNRRIVEFFAGGAVAWLAGTLFLARFYPTILEYLTAPFLGDYITPYGAADTFGIVGLRPIVLTPGFRRLITAIVLFALACFFTSLFFRRRIPQRADTGISQRLSWASLRTLFMVFVFANLILLLLQELVGSPVRQWLFDRYLLPLLPIALIFLLRLFEDRVRPNLPLVSNVFVLFFAVYAVAATHDLFSMYRARHAAVMELLDAGAPDTSIDAGFEHNAMIQIEHFGYVDDPETRLPFTDKRRQPASFPADCEPALVEFTPAIVPGYALSYDPNACDGPSRFAPVSYLDWLLARRIRIYIVDTLEPASGQR